MITKTTPNHATPRRAWLGVPCLVAGLVLAGCGSPQPVTPAPVSSSPTVTPEPLYAPDAPTPEGTQRCTVVEAKADKACTPGAFNPAVTQDTIGTTICVPNWTATVRPPSAYTTGLKNLQKIEYGEGKIPNSDLEEDHLVPLALGGAPEDPLNLWPQPWKGIHNARVKDSDEVRLQHDVCAGRTTLDAARNEILELWTH